MPSFGLYQMPRSHLYGNASRGPSPQFNSLDLLENDEEPAPAAVEETADAEMDRAANKEERKARKMARKLAKQDKEPAPAAVEQAVSVGDDTAAEKKEPKEKQKTNPAPAAVKETVAVEEDTVAEKKEPKEKKKNKKRKREVDIAVEIPAHLPVADDDESFGFGPDWMDNFQEIAANIKPNFDSPEKVATPVEDQPKKKKARKTQLDKPSPSVTTPKPSVDSPEKATTPVDDKLKKKARKSQLDKSSPSVTMPKSNFDSPGKATTPVDDQPKKKAKKSQLDKPSPYYTAPKITPVPLPSNTPRTASKELSKPTSRSLASLQQKRIRDGRSLSEAIVTDTAPSQMSQANDMSSPLPFSLSSGKSYGRSKTPDSARLTSSDLLQNTQPFNAEPKSRSRARAASLAPSTPVSATSNTSSMNIKDAFAGARSNQPKESPKKVSHEEADFPTFKKAFRASQDCVNFFDELAYLEQHKERRAENEAAGPLPCLKSITGCNAKGEQMLSLAKDIPSDLLKVFGHSEEDQAAFDAAVQAGLEAEKFLHATILANVPVPLRNLPGQYALYCPKYSATHIDKYGNGQRTINIWLPAGSRTNSYTARLNIPPRSIPYTTLLFTAPPHASFRNTELITAAEGFTMTIAFLGNGYILLRMDLGLLLKGKETEMKGGQNVCMEFVGVKEKDPKGDMALQWPVTVPIVEEVIDDEVPLPQISATAMETPSVDTVVVKKKRGRPSNAELARRTAVDKAAKE
jgi:hypothetical protein